jgi:hypothetical protein
MINKKQIFANLINIIMIVIPSINAFSIKALTNENNEEPQKTGSVYGCVSYSHRSGYTAGPFARVWIGLKWDISDFQGAFNISGLPVERHYTMYYTAIGFVTKSLEFYLSSKFPHKKVWPGFTEDDIIKFRNTEKKQLNNIFIFLKSTLKT